MLLAYGKLPYHRGKWRVFERIWPRTQGIWQGPSVVHRRGLVLEVDRRDFLGRYVYYIGYETEETRFLQSCVKQGWAVCDVGANIGYFTMLFSKLVGRTGLVHAFEPATPTYAKLLKNSKLNHAENVQTHRLALGCKKGAVPFVWGATGNSGKGRLGCSAAADEQVSVVTLDEFVEQHDLHRLDLVKVDIEGSELSFLRGAFNTLHRFQPVILIEINRAALANFGAHPEQVLEFLKDLKYLLFLPTMRGTRQLPALSKMKKYEFFNVIAVPAHSDGASNPTKSGPA